MSSRYALYFAPPPDSPMWQAGSAWLGRDARECAGVRQPLVPGVPPLLFAKLTMQARRYGFHATLKAPFRLHDGFSERHLIDMAEAFAAEQKPVSLTHLSVQSLEGFLALRPEGPADEVNALAMRCTSYFDLLRAPLTPFELARRRNGALSERQEMLLRKWGYPYTEDEFRFHIRLTDILDDVDSDTIYAIRRAAENHFQLTKTAALPTIAGLAIFRESEPGAPFRYWLHFPFPPDRPEAAMLPRLGRLFYLVGPPGSGKDRLLDWVAKRLSNRSDIRFVQRVITQPPVSEESHEAVDETTFWMHAAAGRFSMFWQANDLCYGIPRGMEADLKSGRSVIVEGSREYVPKLLEQFPQAIVIWIEAEPKLVRERLEGRQRETGAALLKKLERAGKYSPPEDPRIVRIDNSGEIEIAANRLLDLISE